MEFSDDYPTKPPKVRRASRHLQKMRFLICTSRVLAIPLSVAFLCTCLQCKFPAGFYHPNIYPSGTVCLSILNEVSGIQAMLRASALAAAGKAWRAYHQKAVALVRSSTQAFAPHNLCAGRGLEAIHHRQTAAPRHPGKHGWLGLPI
eukprot:1159615-Pelagomonas_calceolata.AAC.2